MKGAFIVFEGVEGAGKSTQIRLLREYLEREGYEVVTTQEPGGTRLGRAIREILLNPEFKEMDPKTEALLYLASRAQHVSEVIRPVLDQKKVVLCDRFFLSSLAYQGYGRGLGLKKITEINEWAVQGLAPDFTFVLLLPVEEGLKRATRHRIDRIERESLDFHRRVQEGFLALAKSSPQSLHVVDASRDREQIHHEIKEIVAPILGQKR